MLLHETAGLRIKIVVVKKICVAVETQKIETARGSLAKPLRAPLRHAAPRRRVGGIVSGAQTVPRLSCRV